MQELREENLKANGNQVTQGLETHNNKPRDVSKEYYVCASKPVVHSSQWDLQTLTPKTGRKNGRERG